MGEEAAVFDFLFSIYSMMSKTYGNTYVKGFNSQYFYLKVNVVFRGIARKLISISAYAFKHGFPI